MSVLRSSGRTTCCAGFRRCCREATGLTKRELVAAMAMQGMFADTERGGHVQGYARDAVAAADALLAELNSMRD